MYKINKIILLSSIFTTNIGAAAQTLALGKLLYDETGTIAAFGAVILFEYVIIVVTNLLSGTISDHVNPLKACRTIDYIRGAFVILFSIGYALSGMLFWLFCVSACIHSMRPFYKSSLMRIQLEVVPPDERVSFNGKVSALFQGGQFSGIAIATLLMSFFNPIVGVTLNGISFLLSATLLGYLKVTLLVTEISKKLVLAKSI